LALIALTGAAAAEPAPKAAPQPVPAVKPAEPKATKPVEPKATKAVDPKAIPPAKAAAPAKPVAWQKDMKAAWAETKTSQRPLLVFIVSEGCVYCEQMEAQTFRDERIMRTLHESFVANRLEAETNQQFVQKLGIRLYPAMVIIAPDAHVIDQISGFLPAQQLQERLAAAAAGKKLK
jgi:protein disulfide-isomerase